MPRNVFHHHWNRLAIDSARCHSGLWVYHYDAPAWLDFELASESLVQKSCNLQGSKVALQQTCKNPTAAWLIVLNRISKFLAFPSRMQEFVNEFDLASRFGAMKLGDGYVDRVIQHGFSLCSRFLKGICAKETGLVRFLPFKMTDGTACLDHQGGRTYKVRDDLPQKGLGYRVEKGGVCVFRDAPFPCGTEVVGDDEGDGWLKVELQGESLQPSTGIDRNLVVQIMIKKNIVVGVDPSGRELFCFPMTCLPDIITAQSIIKSLPTSGLLSYVVLQRISIFEDSRQLTTMEEVSDLNAIVMKLPLKDSGWLFLPRNIEGCEVLVSTGGTTYVADNTQLQAKENGIACRKSKTMSSTNVSRMLRWGQSIEGIDAGDGWVMAAVGDSLFLSECERIEGELFKSVREYITREEPSHLLELVLQSYVHDVYWYTMGTSPYHYKPGIYLPCKPRDILGVLRICNSNFTGLRWFYYKDNQPDHYGWGGQTHSEWCYFVGDDLSDLLKQMRAQDVTAFARAMQA